MKTSTYEPSQLEVWITLTLGLTVLSPYYRGYVKELGLRGDEAVVDFGSGSGICSRHIAASLERGGGQLACMDVSRGWMKVIQKTLRRYKHVSYHLGQVGELDLPAASFDLVVMHFVLHDIPAGERAEVMRGLARCLKPGGSMLLREPQGEGLEMDEIQELAAAAGMQAITDRRKTAAGLVFDSTLVFPGGSANGKTS